ncbi:sensor histidine kinase [Humitalea sp. 24SJ18S-53]|uniref:sensor histidine kinase n=1 Tax=Humitalea sp. 24SJ18S-53 TaxID=3422307 RepID=UPI003D673EC7
MRRVLGSAGLRFALLFASLFIGAGLAFAAVLWWGTAGALDRQTDATIRADATAMEERWRSAGTTGLIEAIESRLAADIEGETLYLLLSATGQRLAGNLDEPPDRDVSELPWSREPLLRDDEPSEARLFRLDLPDGTQLFVGRDVAEKLRLRALLTDALAWSGAAAALFAAIGAWLLRRALTQRLAPATDTAVAIAAGDLALRVPLTGRDDEFDRLGQTMNAMLDRIATLMTGVRGVSDAIAHDLRTPIARLRAKLEDALGTAPDAAALRGAIEQGIADLDGITRIFQAVLRIAEVEAGARRAAFAPFDLTAVLEDAADLYLPSAEAVGASLETDIAEHLEMTGDRDLVLQAIANLLDNAVKFTPEGGIIRLQAKRGARAVYIDVSDAGPGLSPDDRGRAGTRFFRADSARTTPGSGLGLSLVRAVAHLHRGDLRLADARPGGEPPGLLATLRLPA